jgi:hypothetical protein
VSGLSGVVALSAASCSDDAKTNGTESRSQDLSDTELTALCGDMVAKATADTRKTETKPDDTDKPDLDALCADQVAAAKTECPEPAKPDLTALCTEPVKVAKESATPKAAQLDGLCADRVESAKSAALAPKTAEDKTISAEQKEYTFAQLTTQCDSRGGYVEVHAACGSHNSCKGFSYGDWGPGAAVLTEHSCTGVNGCAGLSCVTTAEDKGEKTGAELYEAKYADPGPGACTNCHAVWEHGAEKGDATKFKVWLAPGSTRTAANWLDRSAAEQERVVAFGAHSIVPNGPALENMSAYSQVLSRKQIERLVAHLRTLQPVIETIKLVDP